MTKKYDLSQYIKEFKSKELEIENSCTIKINKNIVNLGCLLLGSCLSIYFLTSVIPKNIIVLTISVLIIPLLIVMVCQRENKINNKHKQLLTDLREEFFNEIKTNNELLKQLSELVTDGESKRLFMQLIDSIAQEDKDKTLYLLEALVEYKEEQTKEKEKLKKRLEVLSRVQLSNNSFDGKIQRNQQKEKFLEML